jgi:predicted nuclease of predicted toxin-antitoxin system
MKFVIDAQLPLRLKHWLVSKGFDVLHIDDLPNENETKDIEIANVADSENRIVISKDRDFIKLHILRDTPQKLLLITTRNINNFLRLISRTFKYCLILTMLLK